MSMGSTGDLKRLFSEAIDLEGERLQDFLNSVRKRSGDVADQLEQLLVHHTNQSVDTAYHDAVALTADSMRGESEESQVGQTLGPYRLIEKIGEGGMGAVFRAERIDGEFEQHVAIKLIGNQAFSTQMLDRFRNERQLLARLSHPNIAHILDGGTSDSGITYLAMELIEGDNIIDYCQRHQLPLKERLELFLRVCDALEYAHRNLVVHRDIKPPNILVTSEGVPKLLDFGIAKLLTSSENKTAPSTVIAITPDYSSPEQILGKPVTTACDVYSLGVLLFEMLTGLRPYNRRGKRLSVIEREIENTASVRPSQAVRRSDKDAPFGAQKLVGDLDTIAIGALRRNPQDRYSSVADLGSDVRNYMNGRPLMVKGRSPAYLTRKFMARNRWPLAIASMIIATGLFAGKFHLDRIEAEKERVIQEAQKSRAVTRYLESLFELNNPNQSQGEEISAKDVLDRGTRRLEVELADQPEVRSRLLTSIGAVYHNLGLTDTGIETTQKAIDIQRDLKDSPLLMRSLASLAKMHRMRGAYDKAGIALNEAVVFSDSLENRRTEHFAWVLFERGELDTHQGKYASALAHLHDARTLLETLPDSDAYFYVNVLASLGLAYQFEGDDMNAEQYMRRSIATLNTLDYDIPVSRATITHNLAALLHELGRYHEAEPLYLEAVDVEQRMLGDNHEAIDIVLTNTGRLYRDMNQPERAEVYLRKSVEHARSTFGQDHFFTAYNTKNLADLFTDQGKLQEAEAQFLDVLRIYTLVLEADNPYFASAYLGYANMLLASGRGRDAEIQSREGLRISQSQLPPGHWLTATLKRALATSLVQQDRPGEETMQLLQEAWETLSTSRPQHKTTAAVARQLADLNHQQGNTERAEFYRRQALEHTASTQPQ